jgi:hypothetical protein
MPTLLAGLFVPAAFLAGVSVLLFGLAWLEKPHRWDRSRYIPSHRGPRDSAEDSSGPGPVTTVSTRLK